MSDLPGTPRRDIDPAVIRDQLEKLTVQVTRMMSLSKRGKDLPNRPASTPNALSLCSLAFRVSKIFYNEFILPVLGVCKLECARGDDIFGSNVGMEDVKAAIVKADLVIRSSSCVRTARANAGTRSARACANA
jgi:hypothetical protein